MKKKNRGGAVKAEYKRLAGNKMTMLSIAGLAVIPLLYSGMLIGAFWDPYGKLNELPVAVVNQDAGAFMDGKELHIGLDLTDELKEDDSFKWSFTDEREAMDGLKEHRYSMAFVIPDDFSQKATTLEEETPQPAQIEYYVDDGWNYLSSRIGAEASEKLKADVGQSVTKAYAQAVYDSVGEAASGFSEASEGASKLADGAEEAESGAEKLQANLAKLADGASELKQGVGRLAGGAAKLQTGAQSVADGSRTLAAGAAQLASGGKTLAAGAADAEEGASRLASGAGELAASGQALANGAADAKSGGAELAAGAAQLAAGLEQYAAANGGMEGDEAFAQLLAAAKSVAAGADALEQGTASVADGAAKLAAGQGELAAGAKELQAGQAKLRQGAEALSGKLGEASSGAAKLADGAQEVAEGAASLKGGLSGAVKGANAVDEGARRLADGTTDLAGGLLKLQDGSIELADKLGEASAQAAAGAGTDEQADMFATPVSVQEHKLADIPNYGTGMTPYFLALGLYVGVLMSTIILPLRDAAGPVRSGFRWYLSKLLLFAPVALAQTLLADALLLFGIGLEVPNVPMFILATAVISLTFMTIVQFFVTLADNVGRFVAVILLTLQLAASAGTYPAELLPVWLQRIGDWMPMTYAINALRLLIAGGGIAEVRTQLYTLGAYAVAFVALILALFAVRSRRRGAAGEPDGDNGAGQAPANA
ncbi:YhgE/Pip domain-containing protein [Cohnella algarum]|uniref:YhgE/Pip domain-containing protein n=1 Tax=Cohnella algarum TaxID=2044859 RepID=UPI00196814B7|nr:YhgE/Pip domain-containing protein [Cohnella algarum]MBN2980294.1 YhgE/Pip domain-containing protein [Cohnella algarum]